MHEATGKDPKGLGKGKGKRAKVPADTDEVKTLRHKLENAQKTLQDDPNDVYLQTRVKNFELAIEAAQPKDAIQTSDLQWQLEALEHQVEEGYKKIDGKLEFAQNKADEVQKNRLQIGLEVLENEATIERLKGELAVRALEMLPLAPPTPPTPTLPVVVKNMETAHLPDFVTAKQIEIKWLENNIQHFTTEEQPMYKQLIDGFLHWSDYGKQLCVAQTNTSAALDIANGVNAHYMAPDKPIGAEGSPERVPGQGEQLEEPGFGYGPTALFTAPAPVPALAPQHVAGAFVQLKVPDDGGSELDDLPSDAAKDNTADQEAGKIVIGNRKGIMAMARLSRAQVAMQTEMEGQAA